MIWVFVSYSYGTKLWWLSSFGVSCRLRLNPYGFTRITLGSNAFGFFWSPILALGTGISVTLRSHLWALPMDNHPDNSHTTPNKWRDGLCFIRKHHRWALGFVFPFAPLEESVPKQLKNYNGTGPETLVSFLFLQLVSQQAKCDLGTKLAHQISTKY